MSQIQSITLEQQEEQQQHPSLAFVCVALFFGIILSIGISSGVDFALSSAFGRLTTPPTLYAAQKAQPKQHVQLYMNIIINQHGMMKDWPAYSEANLVVPANSLVTMTIRNYDLGNTPLPNNSPFMAVQGTVGDNATVDGHVYTSLAPDKVAHTFTIMQLHLNVPIPGDAVKGASYNTVTFTFHTGKAGSYSFQCFDPCGTGAMGWMGPMMTKGYMTGTLTVQ